MVRYFAEHPTAANLVMVLFIAVGLIAAPNVKRETFPVIPADEVEVRVPYPGASAEEARLAMGRAAIAGLEDNFVPEPGHFPFD